MTTLPPATPHVSTGTAAPPASGGSPLEFPGGPFDPLNAPQEVLNQGSSVVSGAASGIASGLWSSIEPFLATAMFVIAGLALMALGAYKIVSPRVDRAAADVARVAPAAAAVAG